MENKAAKPEELISQHQVAKMMGVVSSAISNYQTRTYKEFPEPWGVWGNRIKLWLRADIEEWIANEQTLVTERKLEEIARLEKALEQLREEVKTNGKA